MCSSSWLGWLIGRIVYASSSEQLSQWLTELGASPARVLPLPIEAVITGTDKDGPVPELAEQILELHRRFHAKQ